MAYLLDYSAGKISGVVIKNAGYSGSIRYIDEPSRLGTKHTSRAEYQDHLANGLDDYLVIEVSTADADGGFSRGAELARRALAGANYVGYPSSKPIFFCNDKTTINVAAWRAFLDGAASVLGIARVGAYGFANAMDAAVGHATYFWQAGRHADLRSFVNFWQDNNTQVAVGGITCDRNLILKSIAEDDMTPEQERMLYNLDAINGALAFDNDTVTLLVSDGAKVAPQEFPVSRWRATPASVDPAALAAALSEPLAEELVKLGVAGATSNNIADAFTAAAEKLRAQV